MSLENDLPNEQELEEEEDGKGCGFLLIASILILLCLLVFGIASGFKPGSTGSSSAPENGDTSGQSQPTSPSPQSPAGNTSEPAASSHFISPEKDQEVAPIPPASGHIQNAAACAASLHYPREVNNHWDFWDIVFYSTSAGSASTTSECIDFASAFDDTSLGQYLIASGISWWPISEFPISLCDSLDTCAELCAGELDIEFNSYYQLNQEVSLSTPLSERPENCISFQNTFLIQELTTLITAANETRHPDCLSGTFPTSLCDPTGLPASQALCDQSIGLETSPDFLSTFTAAREYFALNNGDLTNACIQFLVEALWQTGLPAAEPSLYQEAVNCLQSSETCAAHFDPSTYHQETSLCAQDLNWPQIETPEEQQRFLQYLIIAAPWLSADEIPPTCQSLIQHLAADNGGYWLLLSQTLTAHSGQ